MAKQKDYVTFLGERYALADALDGEGYRNGKPFFLRSVSGAGFEACTGPKADACFRCDFIYGRTPQAAATALERAMLREFKRSAKALGYEVEG